MINTLIDPKVSLKNLKAHQFPLVPLLFRCWSYVSHTKHLIFRSPRLFHWAPPSRAGFFTPRIAIAFTASEGKWPYLGCLQISPTCSTKNLHLLEWTNSTSLNYCWWKNPVHVDMYFTTWFTIFIHPRWWFFGFLPSCRLPSSESPTRSWPVRLADLELENHPASATGTVINYGNMFKLDKKERICTSGNYIVPKRYVCM